MTAITPDPAARRSGAALYVLLSVMFINMLGFGITAPLLPFYGRSFHAAPWQVALVFSAYPLGSFFGEPFWGRLSDRIGRKPLLVTTVSANCLCYLALAFATNIYIAILVRVVGGMLAGNSSVVQGYIADVTPPAQRPGRMAILGGASNFGFVFGPAVGGLLAHPEEGPAGFHLPLLTAAVLSAMSAAGIFLIVKESRVRTHTVSDQPSRWVMFGAAIRHPVIGRLMLVSLVAGLAFNGIEATFGFWAQHRYGWGPRNVSLCFTVAAVVSTFSQFFLTGRLSTRFGATTMLAVGMALTVACTGLQPLAPSGVFTVILMTVMTLGQSVAFPNTSAMISRSTDPERQGQMLGLNNATNALARVVGPQAASALFFYVNVNGPYLAGAMVVVPAIMLALAAGSAARRMDIRG